MPRKALVERVPKIWQRLDTDGVLDGFLGVVDSEFLYIHDKAGEVFDLRNVDTVPDRYLSLLAPLVGHTWRGTKDRPWNRRRIRNAIRRHSYKGTAVRLADTVADNGTSPHEVTDQASKLLVWGVQGRWGCDDAALQAADYWHDGAFVLEVRDALEDIAGLKEDLRETTAGGECWYLRLVSDIELFAEMADLLTMDNAGITWDRDDITVGYPPFPPGTLARMAGWLTMDNAGITWDRDDITVGYPFISAGPYWIGLGKSSAWEDEENPPEPAPADETLTEPFLYLRADRASLCEPVDEIPPEEDGIIIGDQAYQFVSDEAGIADPARYLYLEVKYDTWIGQPVGGFRQIAALWGLQAIAGYTHWDWLSPARVADPGYVMGLANMAVKETILGEQRILRILGKIGQDTI